MQPAWFQEPLQPWIACLYRLCPGMLPTVSHSRPINECRLGHTGGGGGGATEASGGAGGTAGGLGGPKNPSRFPNRGTGGGGTGFRGWCFTPSKLLQTSVLDQTLPPGLVWTCSWMCRTACCNIQLERVCLHNYTVGGCMQTMIVLRLWPAATITTLSARLPCTQPSCPAEDCILTDMSCTATRTLPHNAAGHGSGVTCGGCDSTAGMIDNRHGPNHAAPTAPGTHAQQATAAGAALRLRWQHLKRSPTGGEGVGGLGTGAPLGVEGAELVRARSRRACDAQVMPRTGCSVHVWGMQNGISP